MNDKPYGVYVQTDDAGRIIAVNSNAFISDLTAWTKIDEGHGDKWHHAQGNYFPQSIIDPRGVYRYKQVNGIVTERTAEEMDADILETATPASTAENVTWDELAAAIQEGVNSV